MTVLKSTKPSTALVRIFALPMMVGALSACDYASKLPDAPGAIGGGYGGYDLSEKPPSVTGRGEAKRLPPPPADAFARLKAPVEDRTKLASPPKDLAMAPNPKLEIPKAPTPPKPAMNVPDAPTSVAAFSSAPTAQVAPLEQVAFAPLEFEASQGQQSQYQVLPAPVGVTAVAPAPIEVAAPSYQAPVAMAADTFAQGIEVGAPSYTSTSYDAPSYQTAPEQTYQSYDAPSLDTYAIAGTAGQPEAISYEAAPTPSSNYTMAPVEAYSIGAAPSAPIETFAAPVAPPASLISVRRARLPNGAIVNVHPVIGAPGTASAMLADSVVAAIGSPVDAATAKNAAVAFDLRGRAERNTDGYVSVEWKLVDRRKNVVGLFPERQNGEGWKQMSDGSLRAMGQRVADRIARNGELRQATLYAAANTPAVNTYASAQPVSNQVFTLTNGATLARAPMPRVSPRAATTYSAPTQVATRPAPVRVQTQPYNPPAPQPRVVTQAPTPLVAPRPVQLIPQAPRVVTQAPRPVAPPPTFDTLRPVENTQPVAAPTVVASGPRPLMFRGVQGAPGDGDQALSREVGKLLAQSGARMTQTAQPGALVLSAQVSKTPGATSDRIEIIWRVQDQNGENVGQVTQANDVPRGMLDNAWGEDATYAAEGARDGIIELLQGVGALDS